MEQVTKKSISGFWRRIGALIIDSIVLGLIGFGLGLFFESVFVEVGAWGRLVGFLVALVYFGIMNSSILNGQTIGKKILKIRVVNYMNETISVSKSLIRCMILFIPFTLNGIQFTNEVSSYLMYPLSLIIFGGILSITYLYIFNRVTRQSLHDLVVETYVINADINNQNIGNIWRPHLIIVAIFCILTTFIPVFTNNLVQTELIKDLTSAVEAIDKNPAVSKSSVFSGSTTYTSNNETSKTVSYIRSQVFLLSKNVDNIELARDIASTIITNYSNSKEKDVIRISLIYGYDIGIASKWFSNTYEFNPTDLTIYEG